MLKEALNSSEVEKRIRMKQVNKNAKSQSRTIGRIIFDNTVNLFTFLNLFLMLLLVIVGSYKNMLFMGVVICNTIIGIVQEIRSKITIDKLSILVNKKVSVVRNGDIVELPSEEIVLDDVIKLSAGEQIPADCKVIQGFCLVNESLLTGESELVEKNENDELLSGSFISSGEIYAKVIHIGDDNFASRIRKEASYTKRINSEILRVCNKILTLCSIAIFPLGTALFINQYYFNGNDIKSTVVSVVAALVGMIPEGMILLTSTVLAVAVIRLAKKKVLVQQLYCIETLARVDTLCLDKTGTITTGNMNVAEIKYLTDRKEETDIALKSLAVNTTDSNATITAIDRYFDCGYIRAEEIFSFSSEKKWSGATLENGKTYILGAAEFICDKRQYPELFDIIGNADDILRAVTLFETDEHIVNKQLPACLNPVAVVLIKDEIRDNAESTIRYFKEQGVDLKVISGDNHKTVEMIAKSVGIDNVEKSVDATELDTKEKIDKAVDEFTVFGRVTPQQKKQLIVALKEKGHTVAMTGDGVNDVLALKESDCGVAMASGADASKNVAQIVLTDNDFASMPWVVAEGRRAINNIQRSSSLFIVKTLYSLILALAFVFMSSNYPFAPIQLSLISSFTIGLPSFVLALEPDNNRIKGNFFTNILFNALPGSMVVSVNVFLLGLFTECFRTGEVSTIAVIITALTGVMLIFRLSLPLNRIRIALLSVIIGGLSIAILVFGEFFGLVPLSFFASKVLLCSAGITMVIYNLLFSFFHKMS